MDTSLDQAFDLPRFVAEAASGGGISSGKLRRRTSATSRISVAAADLVSIP
jgi:hypothetical protein